MKSGRADFRQVLGRTRLATLSLQLVARDYRRPPRTVWTDAHPICENPFTSDDIAGDINPGLLRIATDNTNQNSKLLAILGITIVGTD